MPPGPWVRKGECNGCGWCCQMLTRIELGIVHQSNTDEAYYKARGVHWIEKGNEKIGLFFGDVHCPCPQHDLGQLKCQIYDTRPQTCRDFPLTPDQIVNSPCSYWFERVMPDGSVEVIGGTGR